MIDSTKQLIDFLEGTQYSDEIKKLVLQQHFEQLKLEREAAFKIEADQFARKLEQRKFWHNTPLMIALVGVITVGANAIVTYIAKYQSASYETLQADQKFSYGLIEKELSKSEDLTVRANTLLFLVRAGLLNSLNRDELERMASVDLPNQAGNARKVGIPITIGRDRFELPKYDLKQPPASALQGQTEASRKLLALAIQQINSNIEETVTQDVILKYWSAVPSFKISSEQIQSVPWSGAFISWLVKESRNSEKILRSAAHFSVWNDAARRKIVFVPPEKKLLPGDIVFTMRSPQRPSVESIRQGTLAQMPGYSGIVYNVDGDAFESIGGNINNAIRLKKHNMNDRDLIGFVRLPD